MKSTIGRKIALAFLTILILIGIMVGITFQGLDKVISSLDNMELEAVKRGAAGNLRFSIAQLLMPGNDYISTQNEYYQREYERLNSRVDVFYHQFVSQRDARLLRLRRIGQGFPQLPLTEEEQKPLVVEIKQDLDYISVYSALVFSIRHPRQSPRAWALSANIHRRCNNEGI